MNPHEESERVFQINDKLCILRRLSQHKLRNGVTSGGIIEGSQSHADSTEMCEIQAQIPDMQMPVGIMDNNGDENSHPLSFEGQSEVDNLNLSAPGSSFHGLFMNDVNHDNEIGNQLDD